MRRIYTVHDSRFTVHSPGFPIAPFLPRLPKPLPPHFERSCLEPDAFARGGRWLHQLSDRLEDRRDLPAVSCYFRFELRELFG